MLWYLKICFWEENWLVLGNLQVMAEGILNSLRFAPSIRSHFLYTEILIKAWKFFGNHQEFYPSQTLDNLFIYSWVLNLEQNSDLLEKKELPYCWCRLKGPWPHSKCLHMPALKKSMLWYHSAFKFLCRPGPLNSLCHTVFLWNHCHNLFDLCGTCQQYRDGLSKPRLEMDAPWDPGWPWSHSTSSSV
jgi:hypothetical protein